MRTFLRVVGILLSGALLVGLGAGATAYFTEQLPFQTETVDRSQPTC